MDAQQSSETDGQWLTCKHCRAEFLATKSQWYHRNERPSYCSKMCARANAPKPPIKKPGPDKLFVCVGCGKEFASKRKKKFCTIECYNSSDYGREHLRRASIAGINAQYNKNFGVDWAGPVEYPCLHCGKVRIGKPSHKRRFCSQICYRAFMNERFDRWIASPQSIALPQAYDEFLSQDELPCLVEGCTWRGEHLSAHMNFCHGVPADEFKRAAGFNLHSGIVAPQVSRMLSERAKTGIAVAAMRDAYPTKRPSNYVRNYQSLEGKEHRKKAVVLSEICGELRIVICGTCGKEFSCSPIAKSRRFCSVECRNVSYAGKYKNTCAKGSCAVCEKIFDLTYGQTLRQRKGLPIYCCRAHRQSANGSKPKRRNT